MDSQTHQELIEKFRITDATRRKIIRDHTRIFANDNPELKSLFLDEYWGNILELIHETLKHPTRSWTMIVDTSKGPQERW